MEYFSYQFSMEQIYNSFPLTLMFILWSEKTTDAIQRNDGSKTKIERFRLDFFLISYSFIFGDLISLIFQYNNSDALGWWPIGNCIVSAFGLIFAFIFSLIAMLLNNHRKYTALYSIIIITSLIIISFMMYLDPLSVYAQSKAFYMIFFMLLALHFVFCVGYKAIRYN